MKDLTNNANFTTRYAIRDLAFLSAPDVCACLLQYTRACSRVLYKACSFLTLCCVHMLSVQCLYRTTGKPLPRSSWSATTGRPVRLKSW